jgi:hypothetical protein|tara:strand:- start:163 stop:357 length:195 start_codon:yes stop_codon:yes gene_type:complete
MGQAKQRGTFEQRKAVAVERDREQVRLNEWFRVREPKEKINKEALTLSLIMNMFTPRYLSEFRF